MRPWPSHPYRHHHHVTVSVPCSILAVCLVPTWPCTQEALGTRAEEQVSLCSPTGCGELASISRDEGFSLGPLMPPRHCPLTSNFFTKSVACATRPQGPGPGLGWRPRSAPPQVAGGPSGHPLTPAVHGSVCGGGAGEVVISGMTDKWGLGGGAPRTRLGPPPSVTESSSPSTGPSAVQLTLLSQGLGCRCGCPSNSRAV